MSLIKQRLQDGQNVRVMFVSNMVTPRFVEAAAMLANIHGVWFDQEHNGLTQGQLENLAIAARAGGIDCFSRVAPTDYTAIMRPMEAGCSGVMAAQVRSPDEVRQIVAWAKYAPQGERGTFLANFEAQYGKKPLADHVADANRDRWLAVQIETAEALDNVEEIAAIDGVDLLFVGPADLSVNLGVPGDFLNPKCVEAIKRVSAACRQANKWWGALSKTVEHAIICRDLGCQLFSLHGDLVCFGRGVKQLEDTFHELMD